MIIFHHLYFKTSLKLIYSHSLWHTLRWLSSFFLQDIILIFNFQPRQRRSLGNVNFIMIESLNDIISSHALQHPQVCLNDNQLFHMREIAYCIFLVCTKLKVIQLHAYNKTLNLDSYFETLFENKHLYSFLNGQIHFYSLQLWYTLHLRAT